MNQVFPQLSPYLLDHYGDVASVLGLVVTFVGFVATLKRVKQAQKSAEEAKFAAREMIVRMSAQVLIEELNSLIYVVRQLSSAYRKGSGLSRAI